MEIRILGPLELLDGERLLSLGSKRPRALFALLVLHANEVVAADRLIDELWGDEPPDTAAKIVQNYVSALRKVLPADMLATRAPGYVLSVDPDALDSGRFVRLAAAGRAALALGDAGDAVRLLDEALALWRGAPLADVGELPALVAESARLEELRLGAVEDWTDAVLALGGGAELVAELEGLVAAEPLRERLRGQLMLALYRAGRQADALAAYRDARATLVDELGLEPGPVLRRIEQSILAHDPALDGRAPTAAEEPEMRRTVTAVFVELAPAGGDPEALEPLLAHAADEAAAAIARHGGRVERLGADALVGLFGLPRVREDDALRALRAALELRDAAVVVGTGVVVGASAAGLRPPLWAAPGEVLVGASTAALVRGAARLDGSRLLGLAPDAVAVPRRGDTPLVGRTHELTRLEDAFARVARDRRPALFTLLGAAGIGKSRLAAELAARIDGGAVVLRGRCLPYGDGITYWPLAEVVGQAGDVAARLAGEPDAGRVAAVVSGAVGLGEPQAGAAETSWAVRRLLETLAREHPLVLVLDDLHWAEPTFLDLVERVAGLARDVPLLMLCLARPELLESRPGWGGGKLDATTVLLEPLSPAESEDFVYQLASERSRGHAAHITAAAEGNPLFIEQMLAMVEDTGELQLPPTIDALLSARLDVLPPAERDVLQRASVAGKEFASDGGTALLDALIQKDLIRRVGAGTYRFRHMLIRDAAYRSLPKRLRAELHEALAATADEEIAAYHLEQAAFYRAELGLPDEGLAGRAATALAAVGRRANARGEAAAAAEVYSRAVALATGDERVALLPPLADALRAVGRFDEAAAAIDEALGSADERTAVYARVSRMRLRLRTDHAVSTEELLAESDAAIAVLERLGDEAGLAETWTVRAWIPWFRCRAAETEEAARRAVGHAQRAGADATALGGTMLLLQTAVFGPLPVPDGIRRCEDVLAGEIPPLLAATASRALAALLAMAGDFDGARERAASDRQLLADLGLGVVAAHAAEVYGLVELLAGDLAAAERELRTGYDVVAGLGELGAPTLAAMLARALAEQGRAGEADELAETSLKGAPGEDLTTQVQWRLARALARGDAALAGDAVALAEQTDFLNLHADALAVLARISGGDPEEAADLYRRKGNIAALAQLLR